MLIRSKGAIIALEGNTEIRPEDGLDEEKRYMLPVRDPKSDWMVLRTTG